MTLRMPTAILHATRLVRSGSLREATELIQRTLRGAHARPEAHPFRGSGTTPHRVEAPTIEGTFEVVGSETAPASGQFITRSYSNGAGTREYKIYVPAAFGGQPLPLVIMLHGCKQDPDDFAAGTRMNTLAEEQGLIIAYPQQSGRANSSKCWNWFQAKHQQRDRGEPSLIAGITGEVAAAYGTDRRRVYIAGLSAGGAMAAVMANAYPDVYAAVGIHSGLAHDAALDLPSAFAAMRGDGSQKRTRKHGGYSSQRRVPVIVFHGDNDTTVHPRNGDELIARASGVAADPKAPGGTDPTLDRSEERSRAQGRRVHARDVS